MDNTSYINAEIYIEERDINKNIRIINSFENAKKERRWKDKENDYIHENEKEIKRCEIKINGELINFCYFYKFNKIGRFTIKYSFPNVLTNTSYMFYRCNSLTNIDLSNFNTDYVNDMSNMFYGCKSLIKINLSNFNTQNVTNMSCMFFGCKSLKKEKIITKNNKILNQFEYK